METTTLILIGKIAAIVIVCVLIYFANGGLKGGGNSGD
jgi:hypothetical protein